jgi:hypothetical protein
MFINMTIAGCFAFFAPKQYKHMADTVRQVIHNHSRRRRRRAWRPMSMNFKNSAYPMIVWNFGPRSASFDHTDFGNGAGIWCAISAFGEFDPALGGHLILFDLGLIIEFPPGSTILIPSASLRHGNTPVQPCETRYSVTQFCAGGLMRWVCYGFKGDKKLSRKEKASIDAEAGLRCEQVLSRFSKVGELRDDLRAVFDI